MADSISHKNVGISLMLTIIWCTTFCRDYHYISILNVILDIIYVDFIHFPVIGYHIVDVENFENEVAKVFWVGGEIVSNKYLGPLDNSNILHYHDEISALILNKHAPHQL